MSFLGLFAGGACGPASALLRGFTRSPLVTRWRNPGAPKKLDRSNKGKQQWFKGRGVGLHGALNKQGRFKRTLETIEHTNLLIPNLANFSLKPYVFLKAKFPEPKAKVAQTPKKAKEASA